MKILWQIILTLSLATLTAACEEQKSRSFPNRMLSFAPQSNKFQVQLTPKPSCKIGDWDVMETDLEQSKRANLLVSLEPIHPGDKSFTPQVKSVAKQRFLAGKVALHFDLKGFQKKTVAGLFICKDTNGSKRCNNTRVQPLGNLAGMIAHDLGDKEKRLLKRDKVYYFQPVAIDRGEIAVLRNGSSEKLYYSTFADVVRDTITSPDKDSSSKLRRRTMHRIKLLTKRLGSMALTVAPTKNGVTLGLPFRKMDRDYCREKVARERQLLIPHRIRVSRQMTAKPLGLKLQRLPTR